MAARPSRSAARLAAILDQLPDALLLVDSSGRIVNANARAIEAFHAAGAPNAALSGAVLRPLIGLPLLQLLPGVGHGRGPVTTQRYDAGRRAAPERMVAYGLDGASFPVDVSRSVLSWEEGELLLLVIRLTSESGPAETELYRAQQQIQAILRAAEQAVCGVDADGHVVLANPSASRLLGVRASDVAGKDLHGVALHTRVDGTPYPRDSSPLFDTLRTGRTHRREREVLWRGDGTPVPVELSSVAVKEGDEVVGAIATFTDATREMDLDGRRKRLVSVLEEGLRPHLVQLREDVRRMRGEVSQETADRLLQQAWRASQRLLSILDDAVAHERFVSGAAELTRHPADIGELVEVAVEATAAEAAAGGVVVAVFVDPTAVFVDTERVIAALTELLRAAIRAGSGGTTVAVTTSRRGRYVRVVVRDTGAPAPGGQPREHPLLQRLLPPPAGGEAAHPDVAFVQAVAERHEGRFVVETAGEGGLVYALELPLPPDEFRPVLPANRSRARHAAPSDVPDAWPDAAPDAAPNPGPAAAPRPTQSPAGSPAERPAQSPPQRPAHNPPQHPAQNPAQRPAPAGAAAHPRRPLPSAPPVAAAPPLSITATAAATRQQILVWPTAHEAVMRSLASRGWSPVAVRQPRDVSEQAAAVLVDSLAGPVPRRKLGDVRAAAASAGLPMLVAAGLGEVASDTAYSDDPAALVGALRPAGTDAFRVLLLEADPGLAAAVRSALEGRGTQVQVAGSESEAVLHPAADPPDLVLLDLSQPPAPRPGILDRLRMQGRLPGTPVIAFAATGLQPGHAHRLHTGQTVLSVQARPELPDIDNRIAELVVQLAGTPEPW